VLRSAGTGRHSVTEEALGTIGRCMEGGRREYTEYASGEFGSGAVVERRWLVRKFAFFAFLGIGILSARYCTADLIHHWTFDEDFSDAVGDADGTPVGLADITDDAKVGPGALIVHGGGDYVEVPDREDLKFSVTDSYTLAAWVKPAPGTAGYRGVVTKGRDSPPWWGIWIDPADRWLYGVSATNTLVGPLIVPEQWTHVAIVQDGAASTRALYVDGLLAGTDVAQDAVNFGNLIFGGAASAEEWFVGVIDDVRIYDEALSAEDISGISGIARVLNLSCRTAEEGGVRVSWENNPHADPAVAIRILVNGAEAATVPGDATEANLSADSVQEGYNEICVVNSSGVSACCGLLVGLPEPIHHWTFDEDFTDSVGDAHGTPVGLADITDDAKVGPGALVVHGGGDYVEVPDREDLKFSVTDSYTLAAWVKPAPGTAGYRGVVTKGRDSPPWWGIWIDPNGRWLYGVSATNTLVGPPIVPEQWTHVAIVQNGSEGKRVLYVNGVPAGTDVAQDAVNFGNLIFGGAASVQEWFTGVIDDVRIYDVPFGEEDIGSLSGIVPVRNLVCTPGEGGGVTVNWENNPYADPTKPIRIEVNGEEVTAVPGDSTEAQLRAGQVPEGFNTVCVINSSEVPACCAVLVGTPEPIHHWTFDEDFSDSADDAEGTPIGLADITDDAKIGPGALIVNGMGDYVEVADRDDLKFGPQDSYTLAAWIKPAAGTSGWRGVVTKGRDSPPWWGIWIDPNDRWTYGASSGSTISGTLVDFGAWAHVAIVQNGVAGTRELYVDGARVGVGDAGDSVNSGNLAVGGALSVEEWFVGVIDDLRIYNVPLTEELIAALAQPGPQEQLFKRGDINVDGAVNIADAITVLGHLFGGEPEPPCLDAADTNDDGAINIADAITVLGHLFGGEGDLVEPFLSCGTDPTEDNLNCASFPPCP